MDLNLKANKKTNAANISKEVADSLLSNPGEAAKWYEQAARIY